jgi:signal transduction histidine kinase
VPLVGRLSAPGGAVNRDMLAPVAGSLRRPAAWLLVAAAAGAAVAVALASRHAGRPAAEAALEAEGIVGMSLAAAWWLRRRPASRFGRRLAAVAALTAGASMEPSDEPAIYAAGVVSGAMLLLAGVHCLLTFPSGHLRGSAAKIVVGLAAATLVVASLPAALAAPSIAAFGPLDACTANCPENALRVASVSPDVVDALRWVEGVGASLTALGLAAVLVRRFAVATPPRRRAIAWVVAVGAPAGIVFSARWLVSAAFPGAEGLGGWLTWAYAVLLALLPLAFVAPLVRAQVGAGPALEDMLKKLARRPDLGRWERDVAAALGDPGLRLAFWSSPAQAYLGIDGRAIADPVEPHEWHRIDRAGARVAAILHDPGLEADPELLRAAGTATLLALETRHLEEEARAARVRILAAVEAERRGLERDLHDGAQQHLIALRVKVALMAESDPSDAKRVLAELTQDIDATLEEVRALAQGIYPPLLQAEGLTGALNAAARRLPIPVSVHCTGGRYPVEVESAIYFCCLEALQNAAKHAQPGARAAIRVSSSYGMFRFRVGDTGQGFDVTAARPGMGIANMTERMAAVGGDIHVVSQPPYGTVVSGWGPLEEPPQAAELAVR